MRRISFFNNRYIKHLSFLVPLLLLLELALPGSVFAAGGEENTVVPVLLSLVVIIFAGRIGGDIAIRFHQPEVLGELVIGVIIGNLSLIGINNFEHLKSDEILLVLSELGVILLLFEVGLETSITEMKKVGFSSLLVAILGVVVPFSLGWAVAAMFMPNASPIAHAFIGATLCATSVGITARVLREMGKLQKKESKIILGAAVIDDVLGLLILAVLTGIINAKNYGEVLDVSQIVKTAFIAIGFLGLSIFFGRIIAPWAFKAASYLRSHGVLLVTCLGVCFGLSYLAALAGLAPIIGAFAAGLILDQVSFKDFESKNGNRKIEELLSPITMLLVPIFFVLMGANVDLRSFFSAEVIGFATVLTIAAIIGKQICSFGVVDKGLDKIVVGIGMIPRGEVGLIFAQIGVSKQLLGEPIFDSSTFGAVVFMVVVTTMITPPLLKWKFGSTS